MKRFYINILFFVLPVFALIGGGEMYVRSLPNIYKYKNDWMERHAEEVETLVLGNSHTANAINPVYMKGNVFNLAIAGQEYVYDHFLFFKWADRYKNLKMLILPVSYFSFYRDAIGGKFDIMQELNYCIYMDSPYHRYSLPYHLESLYYSPLSGKIKQWINGNYISWNSSGWVEGSVSKKSSVWNAEHVNRSLARSYLASSYEKDLENYRYVSDIADYCKHHGVRLVLLSTPQTKEYNSCLNKEQIEHTGMLVRKLQRQYDVEYYDYREDSRFVDDDFFDQSHLSEVGAEKFTKILMKDIIGN